MPQPRAPGSGAKTAAESSPRWPVALCAIVALACLVPLAWPGDAPWIADEPALIHHALRANEAHRFAQRGLTGTLGVPYGPLPTWIYQALLLVTHDPARIITLRAALVTALTAGSLLWLARSLNLSPWFVPAVLLSPYLWFYSRLPWDNSFCIPLSALLLAAYAAFLARDSAAGLRITIACLVTLPLVHFMSLAVCLPIAIHLLAWRGRALWKRRWSAAIILAGVAAAHWEYWGLLFAARPQERPSDFTSDGWWFPLLGGRFMTATGLDYFFGPQWLAGGPWPIPDLLRLASAASAMAYVAVWVGVLLAAFERVRSRRRRATSSARTTMSGLALAIFLAQIILDGLTRSYDHPHYYNATWAAYVLLAWLTVERIGRWAGGRALVAFHAAALATVLAIIIIRIHRSEGTRSAHYGPTLASQIRLVAKLNQYETRGGRIRSEVPQFAVLPVGLNTLKRLLPPPPGLPPRRASLIIRYRSAAPDDGGVEVVEVPVGNPSP